MFREKGRHVPWEITLAILLSLILQLLLYASTFRVHSHSLPTAAAFLDDYDMTFGVLPGLLANNRAANLFFFAALFLSEAASCCLYVRHLSTAILNAKLLSSEQRLPLCSSLLCVIVGFCGSMLFLAGTPGRDLHTAMTRYTAIPPSIAIIPCWVIYMRL